MTDTPVNLPVGIQAQEDGVLLTFTEKLDENSVKNLGNFTVATWDLLRSRKYGSKHYNEQELPLAAAELGRDGKSVKLKIPGIQPTWVMEIHYSLESESGEPVEGLIQNTIHKLGEASSL